MARRAGGWVARGQGVVLTFALMVGASLGCGGASSPVGRQQPEEEHNAGSEAIHIAVAGPLTGPGANTGLAIVRGAQIFVDELNADGGLGGRQIVLDALDDRNLADEARKVARHIAARDRTLAVIGHLPRQHRVVRLHRTRRFDAPVRIRQAHPCPPGAADAGGTRRPRQPRGGAARGPPMV